MNYVGTDELFPSTATADEATLGFSVTVIDAPNGAYFGAPDKIRVVTLSLGGDRFAIKMLRPDGQITYGIWSKSTGGPVEDGAQSLDELRARIQKKTNPTN
jgi:hypothetical protein